MRQLSKRTAGLATRVVVAGGLGLALWGVTPAAAHAVPGPVLIYHWCPGERWDPAWGFNWDWDDCHDDHHRDIDDGHHDRDWQGGPPPPAWGPPPPWAPPPPPPPPWAPAAIVIWNPDAAAWGVWVNGIWIPL